MPEAALLRPQLPELQDRKLEKILTLMRSGWNEKPQDRPTAAQMLKELQRINPFKSVFYLYFILTLVD